MINILFLITGLNVGGAEMQVYQLIKKLKTDERYNPIVVSMLEPGPIGEKLLEANVKVYTLNMQRGKVNISSIIRLIKFIKNEHIQIIHSHLFHANILARMIKIINPSLKVVTTIHNINIGGRLRELSLKFTNFFSDINTVISEKARNYFVNARIFSEKNLKHIPNGVNLNEFHLNSDLRADTKEKLGIRDDFTFLAVGRLEQQKNYPSLLKAFSIVLETNPKSRLLIAGTGPLEYELRGIADELGISNHITFLGFRRDIQALMNASDAYVMSSSWEGMPIVLLEASAVGLPIVCTDVGGNSEVVVNGYTGFLVKPDCPISLANMLKELIKLPEEERRKIGEKAKTHIKDNYELDVIVDKWKAEYNRVLKQEVSN
ncbi:glycosyltransferase [Bacillus sp. 31A1R]|uniref:Glycosyltransferase n=1 Tax=Robertmurraya mangrovi TaxID=3098077 RepID=A0ABU5ITF7_9BACI|nr:glycosyltransferase [Bacillus sp. 31A1R]MDZ5470439.1 glycosyltransferase [Bacillus sp. 31A1R]